MQDKIRTSLNVGVTVLIVLYVSGFLWQYAYLGSITDHVGWIKIVTVDYIYLGAMALVFTIPSWVWAGASVLFIFCYSELFSIFIKRVWLLLSYEIRERIWIFFNNYKFLSIGLNIKFLKFLLYVCVLVVVFMLPLSIINNAKSHLAYRLSSGPLDTLCEKGGDCYKGKVLYTNDKQFYFYDFDGSSDYRAGHLLVIGVNNASLNLAWYSKGKGQIEKIVEDNTSD